MKKSELYKLAMEAVVTSERHKISEKLEILEMLMEARKFEVFYEERNNKEEKTE